MQRQRLGWVDEVDVLVTPLVSHLGSSQFMHKEERVILCVRKECLQKSARKTTTPPGRGQTTNHVCKICNISTRTVNLACYPQKNGTQHYNNVE